MPDAVLHSPAAGAAQVPALLQMLWPTVAWGKHHGVINKSRMQMQTVCGNYLQRDFRIESERWHFFSPRHEFLCFRINVIVKNCPLRRKLDGFELVHPPLAELHTVIHELEGTKQRKAPKAATAASSFPQGRGCRRKRARGSHQRAQRGRTWSWNMAPPKAQVQAKTK